MITFFSLFLFWIESVVNDVKSIAKLYSPHWPICNTSWMEWGGTCWFHYLSMLNYSNLQISNLLILWENNFQYCWIEYFQNPSILNICWFDQNQASCKLSLKLNNLDWNQYNQLEIIELNWISWRSITLSNTDKLKHFYSCLPTAHSSLHFLLIVLMRLLSYSYSGV